MGRGGSAPPSAPRPRRGARVALAGLEPDELAATAGRIGPETPHFECDVTDMASVHAAVDGTVEALGGIDIVLANAGIGTYGTVEKGDPEAFIRTVDINLNGVYRTVHATLPHVLERRGYIGVVASIASFAPLAGMSSYNASKAGDRGVRPCPSAGGRLPGRRRRLDPPVLDRHRSRPRRRARPRHLPRGPLEAAVAAQVDDLGRGLRGGDRRRLREAQRARVRASRGVPRLLAAQPDHQRRRRAGDLGGGRAKWCPGWRREIAALGRASSSRTTAINELEGADDATKVATES